MKEKFLIFSWKKLMLSIMFLVLFSVIGFVCAPAYDVGNFYTCGSVINSLFFVPLYFALNKPFLFLFYFILFYMLVCLVNYFYNKIKNKRRIYLI
jgi:hypothetical protein